MVAVSGRPRVRRAAFRPPGKPIRTREEYERAVATMDALLDEEPKKGTARYDLLELLSILVEAYESENVPEVEPVTPQQVVRVMADQRGVSASELAELLGGRNRLSEFFSGKRSLSKGQILALRGALGIPADLLLGT